MKWLLIAGAVVALGILAVLIFGWLQPVKHSVTRSIHLKQKPEAVFAAMDRVEEEGSATVVKTESIPDRNGRPAERRTVRWGRWQMTLTQLERTPPSRLVTSMAQANGAVLGTWTCDITAEDNGCRVTLTEEGELPNPLFRAFARLKGLDSHINQTLAALAKKFGE